MASLVVFGDDGSPGADTAWGWINNQTWPGWSAEVVTGSLPEEQPPAPDETHELTAWESPHPRAARPEAELDSVSHLMAPTDPRIILGVRSDADLIVVGSRGLNVVHAVLVGSTVEWLMHHPPAPLAIIRTSDPVSRVLVCIDGSAHAQRAVEAFASLPWSGQTEARVLGVYDGWAEVEQGMSAAAATLDDADIPTKSQEIRGRPSPTILGQIEELRPDLVVLGTRGLTGWHRLLLGSTASAVVRSAPTSCLVACRDEQ
jgi:nucleotide-binding universal stress UspA family protein